MANLLENRVEAYCQAWISSLALLLSRLTPADWQVESLLASHDYVPKARLRVTLQGDLSGGQRLSFGAPELEQLLGMFLGEAVSIADSLDDTQWEATEELVRQWAGLAATSLKPDFGEVAVQVALDAESNPVAAIQRCLCARDDTRSIQVMLELEGGLIAGLETTATVDEPPAQGESDAPQPSPTMPEHPTPDLAELLRQGNLQLLLDVELPVRLRFGSRQATLHEVLDLARGAVLELDREIREPVDLVLNRKVIARGEVVVIDGNYGLRVIEVASPEQRIDSL